MRVLRSMAVVSACGFLLAMGGVAWSQSQQPGGGSGGYGNAQMGGGSSSSQNGEGARQAQPGGNLGTGRTPTSISPMPPLSSDAPLNPQIEEEQAKMRNTDRQKKLVADTEKLVALANQLKSDVDKSNKNTLSLDVIRKADEIEKLAHSVKEKMKGS